MPLPGFLLTFEGTEGAGKSTLIRSVAERLRGAGLAVTVTREPGGQPLAEKIRSLLLQEQMNPWTEIFLYEAARAEHLAHVIRPALERGEVVLCDRFTDSTLAYQAHARGLPWKDVNILNRLATRGIRPTLTLWLDLDPAVGLARAQDKNRFEEEGVAFQAKVRAGFARAMKAQPGRWLKLNAEKNSPEQLTELAWRAIEKRLVKKRLLKKGHPPGNGK